MSLVHSLLQSSLSKGQIPLRYPASEPARELVCDLLASWTAMEFCLSRAIRLASSSLAGLQPAV